MPVLGSDRTSLNRPEYQQLVTRLGLKEQQIANEQIHEVISEIGNVADNGGALLRKFQIVDEDGVFEYVRETPNSSVYDMFRQSDFLHDFLRSTELNGSIDGLNTVDGFSGYHWNPKYTNGVVSKDGKQEFDWFHPLYVDGYLAWVMARGGAYTSFDGLRRRQKHSVVSSSVQ